MSIREFMKLPLHERRKLMEESVTPELVAYYSEKMANKENTSNMDARILALMQRVDRLEHALLVMATWHHGQDEYVKNILGPEAVQSAEVEHGYCSNTPLLAEPKEDK